MNNRDVSQEINQDELAEENAGALGALPIEKLIEIAAFLPSEAIKNLRQTCRFFSNHALLKETLQNRNPCQVVTKKNNTFWLFKDGRTFASGSNYFHALGIEERGAYFNPMRIHLPSTKPIVKIVSGGDFIFCFDSAGNCYCWGSNTCAQLGNPRNNFQYPAKAMQLPNQRIVDVVAGETNSFLQDDKGLWYALGSNTAGALGINRRQNYTHIPTQITLPNGLAIKKIISGHSQTFMQDIVNNWFHCGFGRFIGKSEPTYTPEIFALPDHKPIANIITADQSVFLQNHQNEWYACGENFYHQLGIPLGVNNIDTVVPITQIQLPNKKSIDKIVTSGNHTFMRDVDGQWFGCGNNSSGQLSQQKTPHLGLTPIQLPNHKLIVDVHVGDNYTLLKDEEGNWYGCGHNPFGELGPRHMFASTPLFQIDPSIFETVNKKTEEINLLEARPRM